MKANELRIGNYVKYFDDNYSEIRVLDFGFCHLNDASSINYELIEPVYITNKQWTNIGCIDNILCDISGFVIFKNGYSYQFLYTNYKYWHQLQNLYFALTNKELTIKIKEI